MSENKYEILKSRHDLENAIPYKKPKSPKKLDGNALTSITNAYSAEAYVDDKGNLWLAKDKLHVILRTQIPTLNGIFDGFTNVKKIDDYYFVRAHEVMGKISKEIEESTKLRRGEYLLFSQECLLALYKSDKVQATRAKYMEWWDNEIKKLKKKRISKYKIDRDELTGEVLKIKTAEFSHIRSKSVSFELSLEVENGLIVNKSTHTLITYNMITSEDELLFFCQEQKWDTKWYEKYIKFLNGLHN